MREKQTNIKKKGSNIPFVKDDFYNSVSTISAKESTLVIDTPVERVVTLYELKDSQHFMET